MVVVLNSSLPGVSPKESAFGAAFVLMDVHHKPQNKLESKGNTKKRHHLQGKNKNRGKFEESVSP